MKADILKALTAKSTPFTVGGVTVYLKSWSVAERLDFLTWAKDNATKDQIESYRRVISLSVVDESGVQVFTKDEVDSLDGAFCDLLVKEIGRINGIMGDEPKKADLPATPN